MIDTLEILFLFIGFLWNDESQNACNRHYNIFYYNDDVVLFSFYVPLICTRKLITTAGGKDYYKKKNKKNRIIIALITYIKLLNNLIISINYIL